MIAAGAAPVTSAAEELRSDVARAEPRRHDPAADDRDQQEAVPTASATARRTRFHVVLR
jgi:hypothetical protein